LSTQPENSYILIVENRYLSWRVHFWCWNILESPKKNTIKLQAGTTLPGLYKWV